MQTAGHVTPNEDPLGRGRTTKETARLPTNSLERALLVFKTVGSRQGGLTNADLSRKLGIPPSSCSYLLTRLKRAGYLRRDSYSNRYTIGFEALALAYSALREIRFRPFVEPVLRDIVSQTGLILHVGILESGRVLIVDRFSPRFRTSARPAVSSMAAISRSPRDRCGVGGELLPNTTALGKILLASLPSCELAEWLEAAPLRRETGRSIVAVEHMVRELQQVRCLGYATAHGEHADGLRAIAVPICDQQQSLSAAIGLVGNENHRAWDDLNGLLALLKETATDFSRKLARVRDG